MLASSTWALARQRRCLGDISLNLGRKRMENPITKLPKKTLSETEEMQSRIRALADLAKQREQEEPPVQACKVVQLPVWSDPVRAVPNGFLRSALFGAIKRGPRRYMEREPIASVDGIAIRYTGARLDQGDLDVWEGVLHLARLATLGERIEITEKGFLRLIGRGGQGGDNIGKSDREWLKKVLARLSATTVEIKQGPYAYGGSLIDEYFRDERSGRYIVILNPRLRPLFAADQFTQIDWTIRHALRGQPLAQWLHGFYSTHAQPYPIKAATLLKLAGSEDSNPRSAQQTLRKALDAVSEASTAHGQPFSPEIRGDMVHVQKLAIGTQRRHLARRKASQPRRKP